MSERKLSDAQDLQVSGSHNVIEDEILVALLGEDLESPSADITESVGAAPLRADCGDTRKGLGLGADAVQEFGRRQVGDVVGDFELAPGADGSGVDDTLGDALSAEVCQGLDELSILQEHKTLDFRSIAKSLCGGRIGVWST